MPPTEQQEEVVEVALVAEVVFRERWAALPDTWVAAVRQEIRMRMVTAEEGNPGSTHSITHKGEDSSSTIKAGNMVVNVVATCRDKDLVISMTTRAGTDSDLPSCAKGLKYEKR